MDIANACDVLVFYYNAHVFKAPCFRDITTIGQGVQLSSLPPLFWQWLKTGNKKKDN